MPDTYVNRAFIQVTESATGTLTFTRLTTGVSLFNRQGFLISRIDWYMPSSSLIIASTDYVQAALTTSNKMSGLGLDDPAVVSMREWHGYLYGTAANFFIHQLPDTEDLSGMPGGGLLIPADPIFLAIEGVSLSAVASVSARIYFTVIDLKTDQYLELVESVRMIE
jgi:hypothetical protein